MRFGLPHWCGRLGSGAPAPARRNQRVTVPFLRTGVVRAPDAAALEGVVQPDPDVPVRKEPVLRVAYEVGERQVRAAHGDRVLHVAQLLPGACDGAQPRPDRRVGGTPRLQAVAPTTYRQHRALHRAGQVLEVRVPERPVLGQPRPTRARVRA